MFKFLGLLISSLIFIFSALAIKKQDSQQSVVQPGQETLLVPAIPLPSFYDGTHITLATLDGPCILNIFSSWCNSCLTEIKKLKQIKSMAPIYGIAYRDKLEKLHDFLIENETPYTNVFLDQDGKFSEHLNSYTVPETYVVNNQHQIIYRHDGTIDAKDLETIRKLIEKDFSLKKEE